MVDSHSGTTSKSSAGSPRSNAALGKSSQSRPVEPASFQSGDDGERQLGDGPKHQAGENAVNFTQEGGDAAAAGREAMLTALNFWELALEPLRTWQAGMMRWGDEFWREALGGVRPGQVSRLLSLEALFGLPSTDLKETADAYVLSVELPGLSEKDVRISTNGDILLVRGHKAQEQQQATSTYRRSERWFGQFERTFPLPPDAVRDRITTSMRDGVLEILLPKTAAA